MSVDLLRVARGPSVASEIVMDYLKDKTINSDEEGRIESCVYNSLDKTPRLMIDSTSKSLVEKPTTQGESVAAQKIPSLSSYGSKYDNLIHLQAALGKTVASVPPFFGFTDAQIKALLSDNTKQLWEQVCKLQASEMEGWVKRCAIGGLLEKLEASVESDILKADLPFSEAHKKYLKSKDTIFIVRSSSNEDQTTAPNAGGNISIAGVAPTPEALKAAAAKVIASYFSAHSLFNRIAFGDNPFSQMPLCSVLIMEQIVDYTDSDPIVSGVMMTHKPAWISRKEASMPHITASWGFGEGVVSGKVSCDEWIIAEDQTYATIRYKPFRLQATVPHTEIPNTPALRDSPVLTRSQFLQLRTVARRLEDYFGQPMDVEFVIRAGHLYIVQARPIQTPEITSPTFLDPSAIPPGIRRFSCKTIIPGTSTVLTLQKEQVLFDEDLESALKQYDPHYHRAVIVYTEPKGANSHAEVNFCSHRPSIPCFFVSKDDCSVLKQSGFLQPLPLKICPQTGVILMTHADFAQRKGLFVHPAKFPISMGNERGTLQGSSPHRQITRLRQLLTTTSEELAMRLDEIQGRFDYLFCEISLRSSCIGHIERVARKLQSASGQVLRAMRKAAINKQHTLLSFHASVLRQVLEQSADPQIVGTNSISALEATTRLPTCIEDFIKAHKGKKTLCELAIFGKKAFDLPTQQKWIHFLNTHSSIVQKQLNELFEQMQALDSMHQLTLWFSVHFSGTEPNIDILLTQNRDAQKFFTACADFFCGFRKLSEQTSGVSTEKQLMATWELLKKQSLEFLDFSNAYPKRDLLRALQISNLFYELVQLWDLNIKTVLKLKILSLEATSAEIEKRLRQFAVLGKKAIAKGIIRLDARHKKELVKTFSDVFKFARESSKPFSVQHWLIPRGQVYSPVTNQDQQLTVIHQNLLKVSGPSFEDISPILPSKLGAAVRIFRAENPSIVKRFEEDNGIFASILEDRASVTINIPLNFHSFVITMQQNKESEEVEFTAHWRGSDNWQGMHLDFLEAFSELTGIRMKSSCINGEDLTVIFSAKDEHQFKMLSQAIHASNFGSLHMRVGLDSLAWLIGSSKGEMSEELQEQMRYEVMDYFWQQFTKTGHMNELFKQQFRFGFGMKYLKARKLLPEVINRLAEELEGTRPESFYTQVFLRSGVMKEMPQEQLQQVLWKHLLGSQTIPVYYIPDSCRNSLLRRLFLEQREKFDAYLEKNSYSSSSIQEALGELSMTAGTAGKASVVPPSS